MNISGHLSVTRPGYRPITFVGHWALTNGFK
jgi:hypothetical protein